MFPSFLFLTNPHSQYQQKVQDFMKNNRFQIHAKENHRQQLLKFCMDQKYIDSGLTKNSYLKIQQLKRQLKSYQQFDMVIVAPLLKSIQTCYELFKTQNKQDKRNINCYIQPLLGDMLNTTHAIGDLNSQNCSKYNDYKQFFLNFELIQKSQWIYDILPKDKKNQFPNNINLVSGKQYLKLMKSKTQWKQNNCLQTKRQFIRRLQQLKFKLLEYQNISGKNKKILIIASADLLNVLASTNYHQSGDGVNPMRLNCGQIELVHLVINGQNTLQQLDSQLILPFCK